VTKPAHRATLDRRQIRTFAASAAMRSYADSAVPAAGIDSGNMVELLDGLEALQYARGRAVSWQHRRTLARNVRKQKY
jgi:hypothetical protein